MPCKNVVALIAILAIILSMAAPAFATAYDYTPRYAPDGASHYENQYRNAMVNNCLTFHKKMSTGRLAFGRSMDTQFYNTKYWEPATIQGYVFWKVKDGVSKEDALNDFISSQGGKYKIDCAAAINLIILKSKLDVVGAAKFDSALPTLSIRGWKIYTNKDGRLTEYKSLERWSGNEYMPGGVDGLRTGDYVYFKNHPMMEGTPEQGENAIYLGTDNSGMPAFFGLNIGIFKGIFNEYGILSSERGAIDPEALRKMAEE
jgi:protein-glutamine gamma-glutamyltransferase